jgi:hypothetical protein
VAAENRRARHALELLTKRDVAFTYSEELVKEQQDV